VLNTKEKREKSKAWYKANLDKARASRKAWREANPEKVLALAKAWREANLEKVRERDRLRKRKNHVNTQELLMAALGKGKFTGAQLAEMVCKEKSTIYNALRVLREQGKVYVAGYAMQSHRGNEKVYLYALGNQPDAILLRGKK
jgi:hypothetical protein